MRLQKYLAHCGVASRRKSEEYIKAGKVRVNGRKVTDMGVIIDPEKDLVEFQGKKIEKKEQKIYIMLHKPKGIISSVDDERKRKTVVDLIDQKERLYPVGRLDYDSEGLILLTNDGSFAYRLTHPKHEIKKTYKIKISGKLKEEDRRQFERGVDYEGERYRAEQVWINGEDKSASHLTVVLKEGKNRHIRKMFAAKGYKVERLKRVAIGSLQLGSLPGGAWRYLEEEEIKQLRGDTNANGKY
ncbi:MAG TPA: rRNA pseudouridine synthase [Eubacteriaceae bacterium]|nr:rRNA pseudouridine synthase [Eubacteriaceae bacterium]